MIQKYFHSSPQEMYLVGTHSTCCSNSDEYPQHVSVEQPQPLYNTIVGVLSANRVS